MTIREFETYLSGLGYAVETIQGADGQPYVVVRAVTLPKGALRGRQCDIAIQRNEMVPYVPPAAIHTRPQPRSDGSNRAAENDGEQDRPRLAVLESPV